MRFISGCATSCGGYRKINQDSIILSTDGSFAFGVVCDGIGGLERSELASTFVTNAADKWFRSLAEWLEPETADTDIIFSHLRDAAEDWNYRLYNYIRAEGIRTGTTMSCIALLRDKGIIIHVGDSRIYKFRKDSGLSQLTVDMIISRMKDGRIRSYLENYVGRQEDLLYSPIPLDATANELYIFGSDGFYHNFTENDAIQLYQQLLNGEPPVVLCHKLIAEMISRGERDNVSVGVILLRN